MNGRLHCATCLDPSAELNRSRGLKDFSYGEQQRICKVSGYLERCERFHMPQPIRLASLALTVAGFASAASAQSLTGNVGSANITAGDRAAEARLGMNDEGAAQSRFHYEQAFSERYQLRVIAAFRKTDDQDWDYSGLTFENWFQWSTESKSGDGFNGGLRLGYTFSDQGRPDEAALRVALTDRFAKNWEWRANLIAGIETTDDPSSGAELESRLQFTRSVPLTVTGADKWRLGAELFSEYGNSRDLPDWDQQAHQIGPVAKVDFGNGMFLQTAVRFGLTDGADDSMAKIFIGREF